MTELLRREIPGPQAERSPTNPKRREEGRKENRTVPSLNCELPTIGYLKHGLFGNREKNLSRFPIKLKLAETKSII